MPDSKNKVEINVRATGTDKAAAGLKKVKGEFTASMKGMARTGRTEGQKIKAAYALLELRSGREIQREIQRVEAAYNRLARSGKLSAAELSRAQAQLKKKTKELRQETRSWSDSLGQAHAGMIALAAAGYTAVKAFKEYSTYRQKMAEVNTLLDVSKEKYSALSEGIIALSKRVPQAASVLAAAQYDIISAGAGLEESTRVLEKSAKAAVAGVTDTKTAVNVGLGVINAYGLSISRLSDIYDILFLTIKKGVTTFPELASHLGEILPTARAAGVGIKVVSSAIAEMTKAGIRTPQAATALKGAINAMSAPAPEAKKVFDELGITWKGLIPTLEQIAKKSLTIDQMRMLIPDVEARTGVLAMIQNLAALKKTLEEMDRAGGSMEAAYDKMKDTPENQIQLFKNEVSALAIELGEFLSKGLLPAIKGIRWLKDGLGDTSPEAQALAGIMAGYAGIFILWKAGLGKIVLGLKGMIVQSRLAAAQIGNLKAQFLAASAVTKAGLVVSIAFTGVEVYKAIKALLEWREAAKVAGESEDNLIRNTDRMIQRFRAFKDVRLPENITGKTPQELESLSQSLHKARAYWVAMKQQMAATGDAEGVKKADAALKSINDDLQKLKSSDAFEKVEKTSYAGAKAMEAFEQSAKKAYKEAAKEAEKYAQEVLEWEDKIKLARLDTEDRVREIQRRAMTDVQSWNDTRLQAEEKLTAAKEALAQKDYEVAERLARDAQGLYADLAREVETTNKKGDKTVVKSIQATTQIAAAGVKATGQVIDELYGKQKSAAAALRDQYQKAADDIKASLDAIAATRTAEVKVELSNFEEAQKSLSAWVNKVETKVVRIKTVETKSGGGPAGFSSGVKLPGYGGGDRIPAILEAGEVVIRKEAVKKYGAAFFLGLNSMRLDLAGMIKARIGGMIPNVTIPAPRMAYQTGGMVGGMDVKNLGRFEIAAGSQSFGPFLGDANVAESLKRTLLKERLMKGN
ncbi:MAG: phage tail tape measure protein [Desulfobacteraceae bacterium]|jgi:TP901 family phage tail tape measure protein